MRPEKVDIAIHPNAIIPCPIKGFANRRAVSCETCGHFNGVYQVAGDEIDGVKVDLKFSDKFRVLCGHPVLRRMNMLEE